MKILTSSLLCLFIANNAMALGLNLEEPKTIKSERIEYNAKSEKITTSGKTEIVNKSGQIVKLNGGTIDNKADAMSAEDIELWLGKNVYVRAGEVTQKTNETIAKHAIFTACDKCDAFGNAWEISGTEVIHDKSEKMIYFHNSVFWLYNDNLPIFWLPYYEMPDPSVKYKVQIGASSNASGNYSTALGYQANANANNSVAIGHAADVNSNQSAVALGYGAKVTRNGEVNIGAGFAQGFGQAAYLIHFNENCVRNTTVDSAFKANRVCYE